ncbi:hypothetical protein DB31_7469 [Hyalangium minutum]|uniref:Uncharacterized protein n=1 Tax=Hyalangium minutum TaxID=394096 RepID=A0A085WKL9_9BACT|nr:hypothetical protein DB31_7469 [Hyalangium minutum]
MRRGAWDEQRCGNASGQRRGDPSRNRARMCQGGHPGAYLRRMATSQPRGYTTSPVMKRCGPAV